MAYHFEAHLHRLRRGLSTVEYVYMPHDRWPLPRRQTLTGSRLNISVLDSSFNPPTLAHLALANTPYPQRFVSAPGDSDRFHAKLLLLSVRNADKHLKQSDASHEQRLEMMIQLAREMSSDDIGSGEADDANVAVAIIDEPTFVGKSNALLASLRERLSQLPGTSGAAPSTSSSPPTPSLTFLVGMDTLDRLFSPRFYPSEEEMRTSLRRFLSPDGDDSRVICARRLGMTEDSTVVEARSLSAAQEFIDSGRIALVDLDEAVVMYSSSEVRDKIKSQEDETSWVTLVTEGIADYIRKSDLYLHLSS